MTQATSSLTRAGLHDQPALRQRRIHDVLLELLDDDEGGPLVHPLSEADQRSVDSTCRKLNAFLLANSDQNR